LHNASVTVVMQARRSEYGTRDGEPLVAACRTTGWLAESRWGASGKAKRGSVRVVYYWRVAESQILVLVIYSKSAKDDLTADQQKSVADNRGELAVNKNLFES
jgi:mRNA-degrading endonuclease RelE of RelBE toxin-antitoxin system